MTQRRFDKSVRVRYVLNGVPQKANLPCDERPEGLNNEELYDFTKEGLEYALKLNRYEISLIYLSNRNDFIVNHYELDSFKYSLYLCRQIVYLYESLWIL